MPGRRPPWSPGTMAPVRLVGLLSSLALLVRRDRSVDARAPARTAPAAAERSVTAVDRSACCPRCEQRRGRGNRRRCCLPRSLRSACSVQRPEFESAAIRSAIEYVLLGCGHRLRRDRLHGVRPDANVRRQSCAAALVGALGAVGADPRGRRSHHVRPARSHRWHPADRRQGGARRLLGAVLPVVGDHCAARPAGCGRRSRCCDGGDWPASVSRRAC